MMMGIHFMGEVPFRDVYIHALVRDAQGQKMSKSKGNVIEPLALMEKFGTDALRFTLAAFAAQGRDIKLDEARVEGYRNFCNKIWNAARFLFSTCLSEEGPLPDPLLGKERELDHPPSLQRRGQGGGLSSAITQEDQWIEVQLSQTTQKVTEAINAYKYNEAALALYQFVWHVFCDWYLELIKTRLYSEGEQKVQCARFALKIFDQTLRLLHPFMPFITEELWQKMRGDTSQSIAVQKFPVPLSLEKMKEYGEAKEILDATIAIYEKVRQIRTETGIKPSLILEEIVVSSADTDFLKVVSEVAQRSLNLIRVKTIGLNSPIDRNGFARGVTSYKDIVVYIDLNGIADLEKEKQRQQKELARFKTTHDFNHKRLQNPEFRQNAPAELIQEKEEEQVLLSKKMDEIEESLKYL